ncbi:MAG: OmpA family protein [Chitinispirillaceae bacterium]|nr:OmpA family protein [Chitinispirillaceae bacterium]
MLRGNCKFISFFIVISLLGCSKKLTKSEQVFPENRDKFAQKPEAALVDKAPAVRIEDLLSTIYFDYDQSSLGSDAIGALERIAPYLANHSSIRLQSEGNCDERGSSEYNMGLGEKRARSVKQWLVAYGIAESRIEMVSYGKERPVKYGCSNESCHSQNRRVEWKVLLMPDQVTSSSN